MNEILKYVTNRNSFVSPCLALPSGDLFYPATVDPWAAIRAQLGLDVTTTDYHVLGVLSALYSFPYLTAEFKETQRSFELWDISVPADTYQGVVLVPAQDGTPNLRRTAGASFDPVMSFSFLEDGYMSAVVDGVRYAVPVLSFGSRLRVLDSAFPVEITGELQMTGSNAWGPLFAAFITHYPAFPYAQIVTAIETTQTHAALLLDTDLTNPYIFAESPAEKIAVIAAALGLTNRQNYVR